MKITHTDTAFTMSGTHWTGSYPIDELPRQLAFYRKMCAEFPECVMSYDTISEELVALEYELGIPDPAREAMA